MEPQGQGTGTAPAKKDAWSWAPPSPHRCVRCGTPFLSGGLADRCPVCHLLEGPS